MRQVLGLDVRLEALDYVVLADDVVELLRPVLLNPDLLFYGRPLPPLFELSIYQVSRFAHSSASSIIHIPRHEDSDITSSENHLPSKRSMRS